MANRAAPASPGKMRSKGRPRQEEVAGIDRAIRDAAVTVLLDHGEAATMQDVAREAGLSRKSLYARYPSKSDLFLVAIRDLLVLAQGVEFEARCTVEEGLYNYIRAALDIIMTPQSQALQRLLTVNPIYIETLKPEMRMATDRHFHHPLRAFLQEADRKGEMVVPDPEAVAQAVVRLIFAETLSPEVERGAGQDDSWRERYARFLARLFSSGLLPRTPACVGSK